MVADRKADIESDIAQLKELRERAREGGQIEWVHRISVQLEKLEKQLKDITDSGKI